MQLRTEIELNKKLAEELKKQQSEDIKGLKKLDLKLPGQGDNGLVSNLTARQDAYNNSLKKSTTLWQDFGKQIKSNQVLLQNFSVAIDGITGAFSDLFSSGESNFKGFVTSILQGLQKIINGLLAQAIAGMIAGEAKKGLLGLALGAVGVAALTGIWQSKVPKFQLGGIVPGASYYGDKVPILANSGEMILNAGQQGNLFKMLNNGSANGGEVVFRIEGNTLVGVLNNYNRQQNKFR